jgi:hypothetical protein
VATTQDSRLAGGYGGLFVKGSRTVLAVTLARVVCWPLRREQRGDWVADLWWLRDV